MGMFGQSPNGWFGHDWPPPWFNLACAGLLLVLLFMWLLHYAGL